MSVSFPLCAGNHQLLHLFSTSVISFCPASLQSFTAASSHLYFPLPPLYFLFLYCSWMPGCHIPSLLCHGTDKLSSLWLMPAPVLACLCFQACFIMLVLRVLPLPCQRENLRCERDRNMAYLPLETKNRANTAEVDTVWPQRNCGGKPEPDSCPSQ